MLLMHKDIPVADIAVCNGSIVAVNQIFNRDHYPPGAYIDIKELQGKFLDNWQKMRAIPHTRQNVEKIIARTGLSLGELSMMNNAVSLTDCYWFKDKDSLTWDDVNYHANGFSQDFARSVITNSGGPISLKTPDLTTDGVLEKYWISINGVPTLVKFGKFGDMSQGKNLLSANEVVASKIADIMGINHVQYFPAKISNGEIASACSCFIKNGNEEFVNALQLMKEQSLSSEMDLFYYLQSIGMQHFIDELITFIAVIGNTDCHTKNFGIIRDASTLEVLSPAPLYDNGSCLGWNGEFNIRKARIKPFRDDIDEQLQLIETLPDSLPSPKEAQEIIENVYQQFDISEEVCEQAKRAVEQNINYVIEAQEKSAIYFDEEERSR